MSEARDEARTFLTRLLSLLDADPFEPFDIRTSDGRAYMVDARQFLARSREGDIVTYFTPEDDREVKIRVSQIVSLEVANRPAA
ncbi:MAG: hypothetical protein WBD40_00085 [Tepidisphaeraceae bacterium]